MGRVPNTAWKDGWVLIARKVRTIIPTRVLKEVQAHGTCSCAKNNNNNNKQQTLHGIMTEVVWNC